MPFKFFHIPVRDAAAAEEALNTFLGNHPVLSIDRRWVDQGTDSFWSFCVDYYEGNPTSLRRARATNGATSLPAPKRHFQYSWRVGSARC